LTLRYDFAQRAVADLAEIARYTRAVWGLKQARLYREELDLSIQKLALAPGVGRRRAELGKAVRSFPVARHVAYYVESDGGITVLRILHPGMDIGLAFGGDNPSRS